MGLQYRSIAPKALYLWTYIESHGSVHADMSKIPVVAYNNLNGPLLFLAIIPRIISMSL